MDRPQRLARRQEQVAARSYGGRAVPQSGSGWSKGDVETPTELIECKHTERKSYSVKLADLMTFARRAIMVSKRMVLELEFTQPDGLHPVRFVVLNKDEYTEMKHDLERLREIAWRYGER
jgi:hypothetical protein